MFEKTAEKLRSEIALINNQLPVDVRDKIPNNFDEKYPVESFPEITILIRRELSLYRKLNKLLEHTSFLMEVECIQLDAQAIADGYYEEEEDGHGLKSLIPI